MPISEELKALHRSDRVAALGSGVFARNDQRKQAYRAGAAAAGLPALFDLSLGSTDLQPPEAAIQAIRDQLGRPESAAYCLHGATLPFREAVAAWAQRRFGPKGLEFARTRVEMKAAEGILTLRHERPHRMKRMIPNFAWRLVAPYGLAPRTGETVEERW